MLDTARLPAPVKALVDRHWQRLLEAQHVHADTTRLLAVLADRPQLADQMCQVWASSDYAAELCIQRPAMVADLLEGGELDWADKNDFHEQLQQRLQRFHQSCVNGVLLEGAREEVKRTLRHYHQQQMLRIIWRDITGLAPVMEVCADLSALADACLQATLQLLQHWSVQQWGEPRGEDSGELQGLVVIGMGKLGAHELNLSSDIDLIFAYPEVGETVWPEDSQQASKSTISNQQFFTRLGQSLIDLLDTVTSDGFVFRVDMRLRPYGSEGALVCSFDAMENYYQSQGRDWERYAMIKARVVAGNQLAGAMLLTRLRPFVYRRYLDFSAFEALRTMKMQINKQVRRKGMSDDIKLGPGGIREIEFIVQALQLVHGGRDRSLQVASIHQALAALLFSDYLTPEVVEELEDAYHFLRRLEHRLQALANKQTQRLVSDPVEQSRIALAMGFDDWDALQEQLNLHRGRVTRYFRNVIHAEEDDEGESAPADDQWVAVWKGELGEAAATAALSQAGFEDPQASLQLLETFRASRAFLVLPRESRSRFDRFMPVLLEAVSQSDTPSLSLQRVMSLIEAVSRRTAYLVLLLENPGALRQVIELCTGSPFITDFISKHPVLLDELLGGISQPPEKAELRLELQQQLLRIGEENFEEQMEYLRYFKQSHTLRVAAAQISGQMTVMKVSDYLTFTAEAVLEQVLALSWADLVRKHGYPVNIDGGHGQPDFAICAYGKLGGIELSYVSDLDLVFLHQGCLDTETVTSGAGQRAINSREFYTRLAQRIIMMLGTYTLSGKLYETDMRLRPSGESGLLVSSLEAFRQYQESEAWTWEHQALVRARAVAGSEQLQALFSEVRAQVLGKPRERDSLRQEVVQMRQRMREELSRKAGEERDKAPFVIKQGPGGIVDIEFIVQYLVLAHSAHCPALLRWSDNVRILEAVSSCEAAHVELDEGASQLLTEAYLALRSALHRLALQQHDLADPLQPLAVHREGVVRIWNRVFDIEQ